MALTRRQKRIENKRRHRALRKMTVTTYDDLIARDRNPKRDGSPTRGERKALRRAGRSTDHSVSRPKLAAVHSFGKSDTPADRMFLTDAYRPGAEKNEDIIADIQIALDEGMFSHTTGKRARVWLDRVLSARRGKSRRNPTVAFRARGKLVRFHTKPKRKGPVPKHLRPYLFRSRR
jgi:hypothetical protein